MSIPRRAFLKTLGSFSVLFSIGCRKGNSGLSGISGELENSEKTSDLFTRDADGSLPPLARELLTPLPLDPPPQLISAYDRTNALAYKPGYLAMIQGPTSDTETLFNILVPRMKKYSYVIVDLEA